MTLNTAVTTAVQWTISLMLICYNVLNTKIRIRYDTILCI